MRRNAFVLVSCGLILMAAANVQASVQSGTAQVRLVSAPEKAVAGRLLSGRLELAALGEVTISKMEFDASGWSARLVGDPGQVVLQRGQRLELSFEATPVDPSLPLVFRYQANGRDAFKRLPISTQALDRSRRPRVSLSTPEASVAAARAARAEYVASGAPRQARAAIESSGDERPPIGGQLSEPGDAPGLQARLITVQGEIYYYDDTGRFHNADSILVRVYDQDHSNADDLLAEVRTNKAGVYSATFNWDQAEGEPDLYVAYYMHTDEVRVGDDRESGAPTYSWSGSVREEYAGSNLVQNLTPADEDDYPAIHLGSTVMRAWRWHKVRGRNTPYVLIRWPEPGSENAHYVNADDDIYMPSNQQWSETVVLHEYGHHWVYSFGDADGSDYCNGLCDQSTEQCRHCDWCQETAGDAWNEGFADWHGDVITRSFEEDYPLPSSTLYNRETTSPCIESGSTWTPPNPDAGDACLCDPFRTEGFFSALLRDIEDANDGPDDENTADAWQDTLAMGTEEILIVASSNPEPITPAEFLYKFVNVDNYPSLKDELWITAKNCGYDLDYQPPGMTTNITSPSHHWTRFGAESPDATVEFTWTSATDEMSGVDSCGIFITSNPNGIVGNVKDIPNTGRYVTAPLAPGTYYFHIKAVDRSGRWSNNQATYGPINIRAREPVDLEPYLFAGWGGVVVPRRLNNGSGASCPPPDSLLGGTTQTYWNISGNNVGDDPTPTSFQAWAVVDGLFRQWTSFASGIAATFFKNNLGPLNITGGRHTFTGVYDGNEDIHEGDETDNVWGHQWIWTPYRLSEGVRVGRYAPLREGGWETIVDGSVIWYNCDGLRMSLSGYWNATWVYGADLDDDFDCRMHAPTTGATNGFASNLGWSSRGAGCLDAVIVNRNVTGNGVRDIGVLEMYNDGIEIPPDSIIVDGYRAKHVVSTSIDFGDSVVVTMPEDEMLLLKEFNVTGGEGPLVTISVQVVSGNGPVYVAFLDETFSNGDLADAIASTVTDAQGYARLNLNITTGAWKCLVLYRDPKDGTDEIQMVVEINDTPPDFEPYHAAGWYAPLVPRPANDGLPGVVPPPASLIGNAASTYFNYATRNNSPAPAAAGMLTRAWLDGVYSWAVSWGSFGANASRVFNSATARTVRGGRHTIAVHHDGGDLIEELDENDNVFGEQWVWSPLDLAFGPSISRAAPPELTGSWSQVTTGEAQWYNCDGLRTPVFAPSGPDGMWGAVAVMPGAASDVDVRIHEVVSGTKNGFRSNLKLSAWGPAQSDFVLVNFLLTPFRAFDAGVLRDSGSETYTTEVVSSVFRANQPQGTYGDYTLGSGQMLHLHEFILAPGTYSVEIENVSGTVDWGVSLHGDSPIPYRSKSEVVLNGAAWINGPGANESILAGVSVGGSCALAVWKTGSADLAVAGTYRIHFTQQAVDVPAVPSGPGTTWLAPAHPNPFASSTAIAFDLASERDVQLEVFDVQGARVRTLAAGRQPPGRHQVTWDGRDDQGHPLGSGVFMVRLVAGQDRKVRRLVLVR